MTRNCFYFLIWIPDWYSSPSLEFCILDKANFVEGSYYDLIEHNQAGYPPALLLSQTPNSSDEKVGGDDPDANTNQDQTSQDFHLLPKGFTEPNTCKQTDR